MEEHSEEEIADIEMTIKLEIHIKGWNKNDFKEFIKQEIPGLLKHIKEDDDEQR